jgi:hypothetical protein
VFKETYYARPVVAPLLPSCMLFYGALLDNDFNNKGIFLDNLELLDEMAIRKTANGVFSYKIGEVFFLLPFDCELIVKGTTHVIYQRRLYNVNY